MAFNRCMQEALLDTPSSPASPSSSTASSVAPEKEAFGTPVTSSSSTPAGPWSPILPHQKLPIEAAKLLSELSNLLPLGCLVFEDIVKPELTCDDLRVEEWQDIPDLPMFFGVENAFSHVLSKLQQAGWIRLQFSCSKLDPRYHIFRVYLLPGDVGLSCIDRASTRLWTLLQTLLLEIDVSPATWNGQYVPGTSIKFDVWATGVDGSLFYLFNKLPSPDPALDQVKEKYAREALEDLLDPASVLPGLKTVLYPYQRRSAGLMLQREVVVTLQLDPRLEPRIAPDGSQYYYGAREALFLRQPRYFEAPRGGILAETMGLGKTVILLALILATKDHLPHMPPQYAAPKVRSKVGRLSDMLVSAINRKSIPWRVEYERERHAYGFDQANCVAKLESEPPRYSIPLIPVRWNRTTTLPEPKSLTLAATTIVVVPRNLCKQWQSEITKHVESNALKVLIMEDLRKALPPPLELRKYHVVLFSRNRFEREIRDGSDEQGRRLFPSAAERTCRCPYIRNTRIRDCNCLRSDDLYDSPLKHLHFKRLIIDEGHFFSSNNSNAVAVANRLITADHRWVVSGTPAKDLLGVEVDISAAQNLWQTPETKACRDSVLEQRRHFHPKDDTSGAIKSLGTLASSFLILEPWHASQHGERKADWDDYIYRHEDVRRRTYAGFSISLQRTLEAMVVKTQPEDVERDIELPPLSHEVVRLEPSFYDKLTANLFTLVLTANAVTSERTDADYLFHRNSAKARYQLVHNLRQSAFCWTGFSEEDILASLKNGRGYLAKNDTNCTADDRALLSEVMAFAETILAAPGWRAMSRSHELGLFVEGWPTQSAVHWTFDKTKTPLLTGISQLLEAQNYVNQRAGYEDPGKGLVAASISAMSPAKEAMKTEARGDTTDEDKEPKKKKRKIEHPRPILTKSGIPISSVEAMPSLRRRPSTVAKVTTPSPKKSTKPKKSPQKSSSTKKRRIIAESATELSAVNPLTTTAKRRLSELEQVEFSPESPYLRSKIVGTTSAKLSYLISQILKYYKDEKILVFYEGDNIAYYIAQMLELLHIKHEIYAKSLAASLKSEYVVRFDQEAQDRVLLMDVKQAAFGLNLSSASRIYFVNPVCRPNIEAQAIKRAHRIGQTRKVFVETLVLKGTIEEKMLERSKRMTRTEHRDAKALEDDGGIRQIIQSARLLPISAEEQDGRGQMAPLEHPQQLWGREGWREAVADTNKRSVKKHQTLLSEEVDHVADLPGACSIPREHVNVRRRLAFVDCTNEDDDEREYDEEREEEEGASTGAEARTNNNRETARTEVDDEDDDDDMPLANLWRCRGSSITGESPFCDTKGSSDLALSAYAYQPGALDCFPSSSRRPLTQDLLDVANENPIRRLGAADFLEADEEARRQEVEEERRVDLVQRILQRL